MRNKNNYHKIAWAVKLSLAASLTLGVSTLAVAQQQTTETIKKNNK